ncbi:MAG: 50S ribosomal protein L23 [Chitinophagales bacterium]
MSVLVKPIITEKMTKLGEKLSHYGFVVEGNANKLEIAKAVEDMYGVTVESVNTMNVVAKERSRNTKAGLVTGRKSGFKKAIVSLAEGETIDFFSEI